MKTDLPAKDTNVHIIVHCVLGNQIMTIDVDVEGGRVGLFSKPVMTSFVNNH